MRRILVILTTTIGGTLLGIVLGIFAGDSYLNFYSTQCSFNHNCPTGSEEGIGAFLFVMLIFPIIYGFLFTIAAILLRNAKFKMIGVLIFALGLIIALWFFIFGTLIKRQDPNTSIQNNTANLTLAQSLWYPDNKGPYQKVGNGYDLIHTPNKNYCTGIILHFASSQRKIDIEEIDSQQIGAGCTDYSGFQPKDFEKISNSNVETREIDDLETGTVKPIKLKVYFVKDAKDAKGAISAIYTKKQMTLLKITVPNNSCDKSCSDDITNMISHMYSYH